jgi:hypothetical protein
MEDIIKKIQNTNSNKNKNNLKKDNIFNQLELEIAYKIEKEKTRQLELIRDIRKIEKSIKEKELYNKRKNIYTFNKSINNKCNSESESETDSETDSESEDTNIDSISMCSDSSEISYKEIEILK